MTSQFIAKARAVLAANDRGGYTVPTDRLYPFQWNWDSAFVAMGFATFDLERALRELERLVEGQWADGMIPHIVFHQPADSYFPGPKVWRTRHGVPTSGISQPPVFALALETIARRAGPAHAARLAALYRAALASHRWWSAARDPAGSGLVGILHNWESGRDNSPEWDAALARVPETTKTPIERRDTGHVDASMRPRDADYRRYIHLVDLYASFGWEPAAMWRAAPFKLADIGINAILVAAEEALEHLAVRFGNAAEAREIAERRARLAAGLAAMWSPLREHFVSRDLLTGEAIPIVCSGGFLPLITATPTAVQVAIMADRIVALDRTGRLIVPSTWPGEPGYEPRRYWRGPVWVVVNWLIAQGFRRHDRADIARLVEARTLEALEQADLCEYFDPETRDGLGGATFSWSAAIALLLVDDDEAASGGGQRPLRAAGA